MTQHSTWLYNHSVFYISVELLMLTQPVFALGSRADEPQREGVVGWVGRVGGGWPHFESPLHQLHF